MGTFSYHIRYWPSTKQIKKICLYLCKIWSFSTLIFKNKQLPFIVLHLIQTHLKPDYNCHQETNQNLKTFSAFVHVLNTRKSTKCNNSPYILTSFSLSITQTPLVLMAVHVSTFWFLFKNPSFPWGLFMWLSKKAALKSTCTK